MHTDIQKFVPRKAISYSSGNLKITQERNKSSMLLSNELGDENLDDRPAALLWGCALIPGIP